MITKPDQIPTIQHYAALIFKTSSVYHEGDERSRTCPGHGYPAYTETIHSIDYIPFNNKSEMEAWVVKAETKTQKDPYRIIEAMPLTVQLTASVVTAKVFR